MANGDTAHPADAAPNPAATVAIVVGVLFGGEAVIAGKETRGMLALSLFLAGAAGCWLIYQTARRTQSKGLTAFVGIGLMVLIPLILFVLFAATYPADNS